MQSTIHALLVILSGCCIHTSLQLACIQCTSPIERVSQNWDHSCLDGTLPPVPCGYPTNEGNKSFRNCLSALYRIGMNANGGLHIHRGCSMIQDVRHECDPPIAMIDMDTTLDFFCSRTCASDGCNQHSVSHISSNVNESFSKTELFWQMLLILSVQFYFFY